MILHLIGQQSGASFLSHHLAHNYKPRRMELFLSSNWLIFIFFSAIDSSDDDSSSEGDEMPWQQMWLSSDSDLDYDALRKENNWSVCFCW